MKKFPLILSLILIISLLTGCAGTPVVYYTNCTCPPAAHEVVAEPAPAPVVPETEAPVLEGSLFLKVSSVTFSVVGESEDIYLGLIPRELVTWESEDPSVVSVENGAFLTGKIADVNAALSGSVYISFVGTEYGTKYDFVTVTFKTLKNVTETSPITFKATELCDKDLNAILEALKKFTPDEVQFAEDRRDLSLLEDKLAEVVEAKND